MSEILRIAENLNLELDSEQWKCARCDHDIGSAREDVKRGLLVAERDPSEVHRALIDAPFTFAPNAEWIRILEFYCPGCGVQLETEYLPPGHPITHTTEIDIDSLKERLAQGEVEIIDERLRVVDQ